LEPDNLFFAGIVRRRVDRGKKQQLDVRKLHNLCKLAFQDKVSDAAEWCVYFGRSAHVRYFYVKLAGDAVAGGDVLIHT
jgi:hypothetical protein